jgi:hypothetical protein
MASFGSPEMTKDKQGEIINIGGGVRKQSGGGLLITGNAKFETTPEGTFVEYKGKRYKSRPEEPIFTNTVGSPRLGRAPSRRRGRRPSRTLNLDIHSY